MPELQVNWQQVTQDFIRGPANEVFVEPILAEMSRQLQHAGFEPAHRLDLGYESFPQADRGNDRMTYFRSWRHPEASTSFTLRVRAVMAWSLTRMEAFQMDFGLETTNADLSGGCPDFLEGRLIEGECLSHGRLKDQQSRTPAQQLQAWQDLQTSTLSKMTTEYVQECCAQVLRQLEAVAQH